MVAPAERRAKLVKFGNLACAGLGGPPPGRRRPVTRAVLDLLYQKTIIPLQIHKFVHKKIYLDCGGTSQVKGQIREKFEIAFNNRFSALSLEESPDVETTYESITSDINNSVENVLS